MITTFIIELLGNAFMGLFSLVNIPGIPNDLLESAYDFLDILFSNAQIVGLFIRLSTVKAVALILIIIYNFERICKLAMMLFVKIPLLKSLTTK